MADGGVGTRPEGIWKHDAYHGTDSGTSGSAQSWFWATDPARWKQSFRLN